MGETTTRGNVLAQASFRRPITRVTAERHLKAVIQRVADYNADPKYLFYIEQIIVFGSYLNPDVSLLGDIDIAIISRGTESRLEIVRNLLSTTQMQAVEILAHSSIDFCGRTPN